MAPIPSQALGCGTFLSHAGAQKRIFVDYMYHDLTEVPGAAPFLDEPDLRGGKRSWNQIERALEEAPVGAAALSAARAMHSTDQATACSAQWTVCVSSLQAFFVLSKDFVRSKAPMRELSLALRHWEADPEGRALVPVFLSVSWEECKTMRQRYDEPGFWDGSQKPEPAVLDAWAADLERLSGFVGTRPDQVLYAVTSQAALQAALSAVRCRVYPEVCSESALARMRPARTATL